MTCRETSRETAGAYQLPAGTSAKVRAGLEEEIEEAADALELEEDGSTDVQTRFAPTPVQVTVGMPSMVPPPPPPRLHRLLRHPSSQWETTKRRGRRG